MVLTQYYNFQRFGHEGYRYIMETMRPTPACWPSGSGISASSSSWEPEGAEQLPLVAFKLAGEHNYDEFDIASQLAAERGSMVSAYTLPPKADHVTIMRALVKLTLSHTLASTLADDIAQARETLAKKGGLHELDRRRVKTAGRATEPKRRACRHVAPWRPNLSRPAASAATVRRRAAPPRNTGAGRNGWRGSHPNASLAIAFGTKSVTGNSASATSRSSTGTPRPSPIPW